MLTFRLRVGIDKSVAVPPDPLYLEIGKRIKARRNALELKQEVLAQQLGISRGSLANIETGRQKMLVHQLFRYAKVLRLQATDLLPPQEAFNVNERTELPLPAELSVQHRKQLEQFFPTQVSSVTKS